MYGLIEKQRGLFIISMKYLVMWKTHALISYKAAKERHWDKAEEDDEEDRPTDDPLGLWTG